MEHTYYFINLWTFIFQVYNDVTSFHVLVLILFILGLNQPDKLKAVQMLLRV